MWIAPIRKNIRKDDSIRDRFHLYWLTDTMLKQHIPKVRWWIENVAMAL